MEEIKEKEEVKEDKEDAVGDKDDTPVSDT